MTSANVVSFILSKARAFSVERDGSAAVEFALISTVLLGIMAGIIDLSFMVAANRDAERGSALIAKTLSSCPPKTAANEGLTHRGSDCVTATMKLYTEERTGRIKNILIGLPNAELKLIYFTRINSKLETCTGNVDYVSDLGSNVDTTAKNISRDDDTGVAVRITASYTPFLPSFIVDYALSAGLSYNQYTVDVQGAGAAARCSRSSS